jgi:phage terminase large subunit-like protein
MTTRADKIKLLQLLQEKAKRIKQNRYKTLHDHLYPWQKEFNAKTASYEAVCLCAANRIGKTYTGTYIDAIHLLGDYPDDWEGYRFENAPLIWCLGYSGEKTRDLLQSAIFGHRQGDEWVDGLIPPDRIVDWKAMSGTPKAMREVRVKHKSGQVSTCQFWSYSQGQHALMGDSVDWYHIDEEPKDAAIYPQVLTRTATGDGGKGGRGILTFTPENGRTDLVIKFMDEPGQSQHFMQKGWDDAPHLDELVKEKLLESFPAHQRDMRTKGVPMLGHGRIYDIGDEFIECDPFPIPNHWGVICGMDFGYDHPQSFIRLAYDRDNDAIYITNSWKASRVSANEAWGAVKSWVGQTPVAWPHDGLQHEKGRDDATQQKQHYAMAGFSMLPSMASWPTIPDGKGGSTGGGNSVEQGIYEIRDMMSKGKFKIFKGQPELMDEVRQYHRNEKGRIVKTRDDLLDAVRYAYMMRRYSVNIGDIGKSTNTVIPRPLRPIGRR